MSEQQNDLDPTVAADRTAFARQLESQPTTDSLADRRLQVARFWVEDADSIVRYRLRQFADEMAETAGADERVRRGAQAVLMGLDVLDARARDLMARHVAATLTAPDPGT